MSRRDYNDPLVRRQHRQIVQRDLNRARELTSAWALTYRPGNNTNSFLGCELRPLGAALAVAMTRAVVPSRKGERESIQVRGYKTAIDPHTANVYYGGPQQNVVTTDVGLRFTRGGAGQVLDPFRNPSLAQVALEMDSLIEAAIDNHYHLSTLPVVPAVYLGFTQSMMPPVEDSDAMVTMIARRLNKTQEAVRAMSPDDLGEIRGRMWADAVINPDEGWNNSPHYLLPATMCSAVKQSAARYECFAELTGVELFNPVRRLRRPKISIDNPVPGILKKFGLTIEQVENPTLDDPIDAAVEELEKAFYEAVGPNRFLIDDSTLPWAFDNPGKKIKLKGLQCDLDEMDDKDVLGVMRAHAGKYAECCTDDDLMIAARNPNQPLYAAGLCAVQVLAAQEDGPVYSAEDLNLKRSHVDYKSVKPRWAKRRRKTSAR